MIGISELLKDRPFFGKQAVFVACCGIMETNIHNSVILAYVIFEMGTENMISLFESLLGRKELLCNLFTIALRNSSRNGE